MVRQLKGTNAHKYAPGLCLLTLEVSDRAVAVTVWDSSEVLPLILPPDPTRIGQHCLEIVMALCHSFEIYREPVGNASDQRSTWLATRPVGSRCDAPGRTPGSSAGRACGLAADPGRLPLTFALIPRAALLPGNGRVDRGVAPSAVSWCDTF